MKNILSAVDADVKHWYVPLIIGVVFILMGIYVFSIPIAVYITLSIFFSLSFLTSGIFEIFFAISNRKVLSGWGWYLVSGIIGLVFGIYLIIQPGLSMAILPFFVGFGLFFRSAYMLGIAFDMKSYGFINWGNVALMSGLGLVVSFLLVANPIFTGISLVVLTSLSFIFTGVAAVMLSFDLKKLKNAPAKVKADLKDQVEKLKNDVHEEIKK